MHIRTQSYVPHAVRFYSRVKSVVDHIPTESYGPDGLDGPPSASFVMGVQHLTQREIAHLSAERHGSTAKVFLDTDRGFEVHEGDRVTWSGDAEWLYEVTGVDRGFRTQEVYLRRVKV